MLVYVRAMSRVLLSCLVLALSVAGSGFAAHAYDPRIDPGVTRRTEITIAFTPEFPLASRAGAADTLDRIVRIVPPEYASAMTWYRVALAGGYDQAPMVASPWNYSDQLPEPLHWAWVADDGDLITRFGKGLFRLSFANSENNWFQEVDCRLQAWPEGTSEAGMVCNDGKQRTMQIPGDGIVLVDDIQYTRVFDSEETTLPAEEVIPSEELTPDEEAAMAATDISILQPDGANPQPDGPNLPDEAPVPQPR
jgi:hypothetical protein